MAYKKDVDDPRESPGFELMDLLLEKGAEVEYNDPHIPSLPPMRKYPHLKKESQTLSGEYLASRDWVQSSSAIRPTTGPGSLGTLRWWWTLETPHGGLQSGRMLSHGLNG